MNSASRCASRSLRLISPSPSCHRRLLRRSAGSLVELCRVKDATRRRLVAIAAARRQRRRYWRGLGAPRCSPADAPVDDLGAVILVPGRTSGTRRRAPGACATDVVDGPAPLADVVVVIVDPRVSKRAGEPGRSTRRTAPASVIAQQAVVHGLRRDPPRISRLRSTTSATVRCSSSARARSSTAATASRGCVTRRPYERRRTSGSLRSLITPGHRYPADLDRFANTPPIRPFSRGSPATPRVLVQTAGTAAIHLRGRKHHP